MIANVPTMLQSSSHYQIVVGVLIKGMDRLEYIMLFKLPIILSSNSFFIHLLFPKCD